MKCQKGFSLVELMIALVLGLLVTAGAIQLFVTTKSTFNRMESLAERQEALRFVADTISRDVRTSPKVYIESKTDITCGNTFVDLRYDPSYVDHPYCSSDPYLQMVRYSAEASGGRCTLRLRYWCTAEESSSLGIGFNSDGSRDLSSLFTASGNEPLQEVGKVTFLDGVADYSHLASDPPGTLFQLATQITLAQDAWPGADEERRTFVFNTFSRRKLMERLELVPAFASGASP
ncbi:PilW family protein [Halomonas shengliensis]|uniref:PilW family protein n=1 Tax=Halomonas shengliensis TaxID=419597 RepID=UPI000B7F4AB1|nr:prepilin-type N-terminal cleavage/methylation domain-containing protein [Halomonas shengliensis]